MRRRNVSRTAILPHRPQRIISLPPNRQAQTRSHCTCRLLPQTPPNSPDRAGLASPYDSRAGTGNAQSYVSAKLCPFATSIGKGTPLHSISKQSFTSAMSRSASSSDTSHVKASLP